MSEKTTDLLLLGGLLILAYPIGCVVAKFGRAVSLLVRVAGLIGFAGGWVGLIGTGDQRFRILIACGLCLQIAWLVSSFKTRRLKPGSIDLWSTPGQR